MRYIIDVRAVNDYGYCPIQSKLLDIRTLGVESGSLYSWGIHKNAELLYSEEDILKSFIEW